MFEQIWKKMLRRRGLSLWTIPAAICWLASLVYSAGAIVNRRWPRKKVRVPVPVVSVGNITVGGSGKTPVVAAIAESLMGKGYRVGIASSGYARTHESAIVAGGRELQGKSADEIGDEVLMLAHQLPDAEFAVQARKSEAVSQLAAKSKVDVIIVDDGFQHFRLYRDLDIITFDATTPRSWLHPLPYGVLREPPAMLKDADYLVLTRADQAEDAENLRHRLKQIVPEAECITASFVSESIRSDTATKPISYLRDKSVLLFAGIASFEPLRLRVRKLAGTVCAEVELTDHQVYDVRTVENLYTRIRELNPDVILTTRKDWVKVRHFDFAREFYYLGLQIKFAPDMESFINQMETRLKLPRSRH